MTDPAQAFREGARWRERLFNTGIVSDRFLDACNPYTETEDE